MQTFFNDNTFNSHRFMNDDNLHCFTKWLFNVCVWFSNLNFCAKAASLFFVAIFNSILLANTPPKTRTMSLMPGRLNTTCL